MNKDEKALIKKLNSNTRMALRAAIACALCIFITSQLPIERGYWAVLSTLSLITVSFGNSIYQSVIRFVMTIFGCLIGWGLFILFQHKPEVLLLIAFLSIFITVYTLYHHFIIRMIISGVAVVMIFAFLGGWNLELLWVRVYETLIGTAVAILVSGLVLPEFSKDDLKKEFDKMTTKIYTLQNSIPEATRLNELNAIHKELQDLEKERQQIEQSYLFARFEMMLQMKSMNYYRNLKSKINIICFYYQSLLNTRISAIEHPTGVRAYLTDNAIEYYQERIDTEIKELKKLTKI